MNPHVRLRQLEQQYYAYKLLSYQVSSTIPIDRKFLGVVLSRMLELCTEINNIDKQLDYYDTLTK